MPATVEVRAGDLFEGPSDLIVLPCSTLPTVTQFVRNRLREFAIPEPDQAMDLGEVRFVHLADAEHLAARACFAASVRGAYSSEVEAIERIGRRLGEFAAEERDVRAIACPLLGTGAGGLDLLEAAHALTRGFLETAPDQAVLRLCALADEDYRELSTFFRGGGGESLEAEADGDSKFVQPRVFLSYTASNEDEASQAHRRWVRELATWLCENGVDARLDQWHLKKGWDVAQWMCNELDQAANVLLICDERYVQKADRRHGGVGWEIRLVQGELLSDPRAETSTKFLPIIRTEDMGTGTPAFLKSVNCFHWPPAGDDADVRREILETIFEVEDSAPEIGEPPVYIRKKLMGR